VIKWKKNMDFSKKRSDVIDDYRKRGWECMGFFEWFCDNQNPAADEIAELIKDDDLWPNALQYYLTPYEEEEGDEAM